MCDVSLAAVLSCSYLLWLCWLFWMLRSLRQGLSPSGMDPNVMKAQGATKRRIWRWLRNNCEATTESVLAFDLTFPSTSS